MHRVIAVVMIVSLGHASVASAETLREAATRAGIALAQQPTSTGSGGHVTRNAGLAMVAGGAVLMVLGGTALQSEPEAYKICVDLRDNFGLNYSCGGLKTANKGLIGAGALVAGTGALLAITSSHASIVNVRFAPGRVSLGTRFGF